TSGVATTLSANVLYTATVSSDAEYAIRALYVDGAQTGTLPLSPGDNKTCTITNDDKAPKLTLIKTVINNNGGTKQVSDFPLFVRSEERRVGKATTLCGKVLYTTTETTDPGNTASAWGGDGAASG